MGIQHEVTSLRFEAKIRIRNHPRHAFADGGRAKEVGFSPPNVYRHAYRLQAEAPGLGQRNHLIDEIIAAAAANLLPDLPPAVEEVDIAQHLLIGWGQQPA